MPRREPECNRTNKNTPTHLPVLELGENSKRVLPSVVASIVAGIITALVVHSSSVGSVLGRVYPMGIAIGGTNIAINSRLKWIISKFGEYHENFQDSYYFVLDSDSRLIMNYGDQSKRVNGRIGEVIVNIGRNRTVSVNGTDLNGSAASIVDLGNQNLRGLKQRIGGCITNVTGGEESIYNRKLLVRGGPEGTLLFEFIAYEQTNGPEGITDDSKIKTILMSYFDYSDPRFKGAEEGCSWEMLLENQDA